MKKYEALLKEYESAGVPLMRHEWGQNTTSLYNRVAELWDSIEVGAKVAIISNEKLGVKSATKFFIKQGLEAKIVGKGANGLRVVELVKHKTETLPKINSKTTVSFEFANRSYEVNVGDAIFSKTGLDTGTRFLLSTVLRASIDFNTKKVGDFGAGWGAISLVIAGEFPGARIFAYEKDPASLEAARANLAAHPNVSVHEADLVTMPHISEELDYIISNPPFHIRTEEREAFFAIARRSLKNGGEMFFVAEGSFVGRFRKSAEKLFTILSEENDERYIVFRLIAK